MPEMLNELIDKLQSEAVDEAERRARAIVEEAETRAERLLAEAADEAEALRREAEKSAEASRERGSRALEQAARDLLLRLRTEVLATARALARPGLAQALDGETLRRMLIAMIETYAANDGAPHRARVLLSEADRADLEAHHAALFRDELAGGVELRPDPELDRGFVVRFDGQDLVHDVTLDALSDVLASMVQPELTAVLRRAVAEPDAKASGEGFGAPRPDPSKVVTMPPSDVLSSESS